MSMCGRRRVHSPSARQRQHGGSVPPERPPGSVRDAFGVTDEVVRAGLPHVVGAERKVFRSDAQRVVRIGGRSGDAEVELGWSKADDSGTETFFPAAQHRAELRCVVFVVQRPTPPQIGRGVRTAGTGTQPETWCGQPRVGHQMFRELGSSNSGVFLQRSGRRKPGPPIAKRRRDGQPLRRAEHVVILIHRRVDRPPPSQQHGGVMIARPGLNETWVDFTGRPWAARLVRTLSQQQRPQTRPAVACLKRSPQTRVRTGVADPQNRLLENPDLGLVHGSPWRKVKAEGAAARVVLKARQRTACHGAQGTDRPRQSESLASHYPLLPRPAR
ncbi:hypothetical protein GA0070214_11543 [Micromonospora chaiyaphumensis]|uniref:Uncharacterized protein n=1 Tax=Micromonospora chaiyaphumensis TaxID=307119 RepID=A0A1C4ZJ64_9ACTN|nr:hypothetical protein GA0070214_11543 [Micromonospora chaiyaphumensis]